MFLGNEDNSPQLLTHLLGVFVPRPVARLRFALLHLTQDHRGVAHIANDRLVSLLAQLWSWIERPRWWGTANTLSTLHYGSHFNVLHSTQSSTGTYCNDESGNGKKNCLGRSAIDDVTNIYWRIFTCQSKIYSCITSKSARVVAKVFLTDNVKPAR